MEWLLFWLLITAGLLPVWLGIRRLRFSAWASGVTAAVVVSTVATAMIWNSRAQRRLEVDREFFQSIPRQGRPGGYVSSDTCQSCHPNQYATWHRSFHRTMTQYASPQSVVGGFRGQQLTLYGETYKVERRADEFWVDLPDPQWQPDPNSRREALSGPPHVERRVGLLTGSHHMQVYWVPGRSGNMQLDFPFVWLIADQRWVPMSDTFLCDPKISHYYQAWNLICFECHSTGGQPRLDAQTRLLDTRVGEMGIACEACHGPAEAHVRANHDPLRRYASHWVKQPDPTMVNPARCSRTLSAQICGQCHGIKWFPPTEHWREEGFSFRPGGDLEHSTPVIRPAKIDQQPWLREGLVKDPTFVDKRYWSDGMVRVSGRDYNGLIESPCYQRGEMTCLSCHSMHQSEPENQLKAGMNSDQACLQCHGTFRKKIAEHSHHRLGSSGSECYNCHMPFTTYGLMKAIRSHQISSPTVQSSLQTGRPNACNLCHLDKTLDWTAGYLKEWYHTPAPTLDETNRTTAAAVLWLLRGDAGQRALIAWHMGWEPARQASGQGWLAPFLAQLLADPYGTVRYIAYGSLKRLPAFHDFGYDFVSPETERARARERALDTWSHMPAKAVDRTGPEVLIGRDGALQTALVERLRGQRDDRSMDLQE
jgi:predicted CXXCH cytochrome family protein